jgi:RNA polymerase sigma factor (sigma-70 family)
MAARPVVDDRAFERLYHRYVRDVYRFSLALVRNPTEAEDVTQTTFMNAYRALRAGEEPRRPQSWLLTIAHNAARSRVRRSMRRPREVPLDDVVGQLAVPEHERTNVRELLRALGRLPFNQRAAITMRELEGRSYPEIAETLGVTVPAVEALLARARRTLRLQAAAIRGLSVVGLPRSLRRLFESGDAAGGSVGLVSKVAAVVVAGAVAGGVGFTAGEATPPSANPAPAVELRAQALPEPVSRRTVAAARTAAAPAPARARARRPVTATRSGPPVVPDDAAEATRADAAPAPAGSPAPRPSPAPQPSTPAGPSVRPARDAAHAAAATPAVQAVKSLVKSTVSAVQDAAAALPPVPAPPPAVQAPPAPQAPAPPPATVAVPTLPSLP